MPPLPVMELQRRFDPLLLPPSLLQNPTWTPGTRRDTFYRYRVRKMVFLVTASVCDEGGLETAMPSLSEADLGIIRSYLRYILIILRSVSQRTFAKQFVSLYASDLSRKLPTDTFDFPPCGASMIGILVKLCDRVRLPDSSDQVVLIPMLQMVRLATDAWAGNQGSEKEWAPYSAKTGLFRDVSTGYDDLYMETNADVRLLRRRVRGKLVPGIKARINMGKPMKFVCGPPTVSRRYAVQEEFRNLQFRSAKCLRDYSNLPSLVRLTREHLELMAEYFRVIQAKYCWTVATHSSQDLAIMRQVIADYLVHAVGTIPIVMLCTPRGYAHSISGGRRGATVACSSVPTLRTVMRAQRLFGFTGDEEKIHAEVMCGKLAGTFRVARVVSLHPYHEAQLELCRSFRHHPSEFSGSTFGYLDYASASVRPYGELILKAIPAGVHAPLMLPEGMLVFLTPHIVEYLVQTSLIYTIALERGTLISQLPHIHPSCSYCFLLAQRFDMIAGFPAFSSDLGTRETIMSCIRAGDAICNTLRRSTDVQDLPLSPAVTCVIAVPSWDRQRIAELTKAELKDLWACETALLADEMALSNNLGDMFVKALKADLEGFVVHKSFSTSFNKLSPNPLANLPVSGSNKRALPRLAAQELSCFHLVVLWINRTRFLASCIYEAILLGDSKVMPSRVVDVVQRAVMILLKNMAELGRASIRFGNFRNTLGTGHFVPCQATMVFVLAEFFVDRVGLEGDGDVLRRNFLFRELSTLFDVMVTHPKYCELGCRLPGFPNSAWRTSGELDILLTSKKKQQQGLLVRRGEIRRGFGERLMHYNPQLSDFYVHRIALPELVATRSNTPETEDGEISGNDALPSLANVTEDMLMGEAW
ncbi:hypothetical protein C8J57DRAFT_1220903 [Mycena rebaudengoi]|nr:hypothetical protein C8J57DRAFT_1220903 [Mycena rebaudengoi]